ncbi:MAG: amidohydrolase family protein, partial [Sediminibacterium sp.]|nr:amidohydrolase family protein [Sediminibacterium sp.]
LKLCVSFIFIFFNQIYSYSISFTLVKTILTDTNSTLIIQVQIYDGTGAAPYVGSVRIKNDKIIAVGKIHAFKNEQIINGNGWALAPGFIDAHSHHYGLLKNDPSSIATANQGITTIVIGQDGESYLIDTIVEQLKFNPISVNIATYTGHSTLREMVMGEHNLERPATQEEINKMKSLLILELKKGSLGLSTGLEYESAFYSSKDEVLQLASVLKKEQGRYISHIRSEDVNLNDALDEIIDIGNKAQIPVQISHIKIAKKENWHTANQVLKKLDSARKKGIQITADVYPYNFWNSTLRVLFPDKQFNSLASATFAVNQLFDAQQSYLVKFKPEPIYENKTIAAIAVLRNESIPQTLINLIEMASNYKKLNPNYTGSIEALAGKSMSDEDVANFIKWKNSVICSDGNGGGHPRGYGAFTRILGKYVREQKIISLAAAIRKMTGQTAQNLGIKNRGIIASNYYADLVLFDPKNVHDMATINNSHAISTGIKMVWVNGKIVYKYNEKSTNFTGIFLKK